MSSLSSAAFQYIACMTSPAPNTTILVGGQSSVNVILRVIYLIRVSDNTYL